MATNGNGNGKQAAETEQKQQTLKELYTPLNESYRTLTDDRWGKVRKLMQAMTKNPDKQFFITAEKLGVIVITMRVSDEAGKTYVFSFGKSVEGFVAFAESDDPLQMLPVEESQIAHVKDVFDKLAGLVESQIAALVDRPVIVFS